MNLYDMKQVRCCKCEQFIGEVECDSEIIRPLCGKCARINSEMIKPTLKLKPLIPVSA